MVMLLSWLCADWQGSGSVVVIACDAWTGVVGESMRAVRLENTKGIALDVRL